MFDTATFTSIQNNAGLPAWNVLLEPSGFINLALPWIFGVAGIILLLNIITSGLKMMTSQGEPKTLQAAQAKLTTSLIGILILFGSFFIVKLIMQFFGINFTTPII
jgi:hypothetical protein